MSLFLQAPDDQIWSAFFDPDNLGPPADGGWHAWFPLGPNTFPKGSPVTAVSTKLGGVSLFVVGFDGHVWSTFFDPANPGPPERGGWHPWFALDLGLPRGAFPLHSVVSAVSPKPGAVDLVLFDTAGRARATRFDPESLGPATLGGWQPWSAIGANTFPVPGSIGGARTAHGVVSLFTGGIDGRVWSAFRDPFNAGLAGAGGWQTWFNLGQNEFPSPLTVAATSTKDRGVSLFTLGYDEKVWSAFFDPADGWHLWFDLGPNRFPRPGVVAAVSTKAGGISLFILGFDGRVWSKFFDPGNLGPAELGGWSHWFPVAEPRTFPTPGAVTAVSTRPGGASLFVVGSDGKVWSAYFDPNNLGPQHLAGWQGWFPIGTKTFPTIDEIRCVRLHVKVVTTPNIPIATMINGMDLVYQTAGMRVAHITNEFLNLPLLSSLDVGACQGAPSAEQTALFENINFIGPEDVVAYFVQSVIQTGGTTLNGCATCPANRPGVSVAQIASRWTLAHEFGHLLQLSHVDDPPPPASGAPAAQLDRLMTGRGTGLITNPPPDLTAGEIATIRAHPRAVPGSRM